MKHYSERETRELRGRLEEVVMSWPGVSAREMFGCPCYKANGKVFAFLVTRGIVITRLPQPDRQVLLRLRPSQPYRAGKRSVRSWIKTEVEGSADLAAVLPYVEKSYQAALEQS